MAGKFARSWALMKASAAVLRSDKALLAFPLLSGLCSLVVAASFLVPVAQAEIASAGRRGLAWTVATFLVVPVLASQAVGPVDAVKRSVELLKRTWGENLIGTVGLGAAFGLMTFLAVLLGALLIGGAFALHSMPAVVVAVIVVVVALVLLSL